MPQLRWRTVLLCLVLVCALMSAGPVSARAAGEPGKFYDGSAKYSSITNCASIIIGSPYQESGAAAYVGAYADPDESPPVPGVNQPFYIRIVVWGLGNSCSGQFFLPAIQLPSGVSFATEHPLLCFTDRGQVGGSDCPQWSNVGSFPFASGAHGYYSSDTGRGGLWPLPQGRFWEFRFPVRSATALTAASLQGFAKMLDGNSSPVLAPTGAITVFRGQGEPLVLYDAPSTTATPTMPNGAAARFGVMSEATVTTHRAPGDVLVRLGTASNTYDPDVVRLPVDGSSSSWRFWTDWDDPQFSGLVPGRRYFWRAGFDPGSPGGGDVVYGAEQSFTALWSLTCGGRPITVSTGLGQLPTAGGDTILGTKGPDRINGAAGDDRICGGDGDDRLDGGPGNDVLGADGGNDVVVATSGNDTVSGGAGTDTVSYGGLNAAVRVTLASASTQDTLAGGMDKITTVENATGGNANDQLTGGPGANRLDGGPGNDALAGGSGNDLLVATSGNDTVGGGAGTDTVSYAGLRAAVRVTLASASTQDTLGGGKDRITTMENLTGGSGNDRLTGSSGPNRLDGGPGNDQCFGGAGRDTSAGCESRTSIP
jgi:Ca2+-binding RTX toxin-like protein